MYSRNYTLSFVYRNIPIHYVIHMLKYSIEKVANEKKIVALAVIIPHYTTLCILFTIVSTYRVPSTTTSVYNALELRTMKKKVNVSTDSSTHPPQHDNNGDACVMSIKTGYKWSYSLFILLKSEKQYWRMSYWHNSR